MDNPDVDTCVYPGRWTPRKRFWLAISPTGDIFSPHSAESGCNCGYLGKRRDQVAASGLLFNQYCFLSRQSSETLKLGVLTGYLTLLPLPDGSWWRERRGITLGNKSTLSLSRSASIRWTACHSDEQRMGCLSRATSCSTIWTSRNYGWGIFNIHSSSDELNLGLSAVILEICNSVSRRSWIIDIFNFWPVRMKL